MTCFWRKFKAILKFPFVADSECADDAVGRPHFFCPKISPLSRL